MKIYKNLFISSMACLSLTAASAQTFTSYTTTEKESWISGKQSMTSKSDSNPLVVITGNEEGVEFKAWGTTFNELDWDAFNLLTRDEQDEIMFNLFSPEGDLHFTHGRVSMNANDYARSWYSCSEVSGDFE